jgi:hypothetical protein
VASAREVQRVNHALDRESEILDAAMVGARA